MSFSQTRFEAAFRVVQTCGVFPALPGLAIVPHIFDALPSTNQVAWELLAGESSIPVVIALEQTAGRGQWGRQWVSQAGGLYLSVGLTPNLAVEDAAQLTLCTAWGIATSLRTIPGRLSGISGAIPVQLKWLNDLILQGRKLGGILTETRLQQGHITRAVVGVGVNWANPVPEVGINLKSYLENQPVPLIESLEMLAAIVLYGILAGYHRWQQQGIEPILPEYLQLLSHRDRPITINGQTGTITGITPSGELRFLPAAQPLTALASQAGSSTSIVDILLKPGTISLGYDHLDQ